MKSHDTLHQTSCAYTPQQNRVVEHKNKHLVETTRTMLLYGNVPQRFWGVVILSACYLINRMSSSILENKILHYTLFPFEPLHPLPPKVFGFTRYVHNCCLGLDKLFVRSHKYIFLGFTRSQKGYKCFSLFLNRYFIFADITFIESSFYFILSLYLLHLCLHLNKYIFQLSLIILLYLVCLKIFLLHHLFKFTVVVSHPIVHKMPLL